jgi:hypothetical protein
METCPLNCPDREVMNMFINNGKVYLAKHALELHPTGLYVVRASDNAKVPLPPRGEWVEEAYDCAHFDVSKLNGALPTGRNMSVGAPTLYAHVNLYSRKNGKFTEACGQIKDVRKDDFDVSYTSENGDCTGVVVSQATGAILGFHYLGRKTPAYNAAVKVPKN